MRSFILTAALTLFSGCLLGAPEPTDKDGSNLDDSECTDSSTTAECTDTSPDTDECEPQTWYADNDQDGYGDAATPTSACETPAGYVADATDCDDANLGIYPGAEEQCDDVDNDCDGTIDEDYTNERRLRDIDGDGYGDPDNYAFVNVCAPWEEGYVNWIEGRDDCDDTTAEVHPDATEICNGIDDNCDGFVDETCVVPEIVNQCAAYEAPSEPTVGTYFTSAWSSAVPFAATLGDTINFGAILLKSETGVDLTVDGLIVFPFIDENGDGIYTSSSENGVMAKDFIGECILREVTSRAVYAGPVEMDATDGGRLYFGDDFTVSGTTATAVNIECTTKGTVPSGQRYGIAMDVLGRVQSVFVTESGGSSFINVRICANNGTQSGYTLQPAVAAYFAG